MNKSRGVLIVKIAAVVVWLVALLFPTIFAKIENVEMKDYNQIAHEGQTDTKYYFEVEFTKEVESGSITFGFYDEEGHLLFSEIRTFENNKSNKVVIEVESGNFELFAESLADYKFDGATITTKSAALVESVMYPVSIVLAVALVFVLRIRYKEYEVEGKKVQIYAGILNHTVYVDNIQAYSERYLLTNKKTMLVVPLSETQEMEIVFRANNRIESMTRRRPVVENGDVVVNGDIVINGDVINGNVEKTEEKPSKNTEFVVCSFCGTENDVSSKKCENCGSPLVKSKKPENKPE